MQLWPSNNLADPGACVAAHQIARDFLASHWIGLGWPIPTALRMFLADPFSRYQGITDDAGIAEVTAIINLAIAQRTLEQLQSSP